MCSRSASRNITHKSRWRRCSALVIRRSASAPRSSLTWVKSTTRLRFFNEAAAGPAGGAPIVVTVLVVALILAQSIELAVAAELAHLAPQRLLAIGPRQQLEGANRQQIGIDANLVVGGQRVTAPQEAERRRL